MDLRYEIWDSEHDWAQVGIDKESGDIIDIQTGDWTWFGRLSYGEGIAWLKENGFTDFRSEWDSWEEWDAYISA